MRSRPSIAIASTADCSSSPTVSWLEPLFGRSGSSQGRDQGARGQAQSSFSLALSPASFLLILILFFSFVSLSFVSITHSVILFNGFFSRVNPAVTN